MSLTVRNLNKSIRNIQIIKNINLDVNNGECLALLGPSGCGKSTTLRCIAGLEKLNSGEIFLDGNEITNLPANQRQIGMVFQNYALFPHLDVFSNLSIGLKVRGVSSPEIKQKVYSIIQILSLGGLEHRLPAQLSGGQRQRVALARALLRESNVFLLDEPMSNLDAQLREQIKPEMSKLILKGKQPVIYVTHDQQEAMGMANKIAVMNNGYIEQLENPQDLYKKPKSLFVAKFIGRPQMNIIEESKKELIGIRPEHLYLTDSNKGIISTMIHREWLGNNQLWHLENYLGSMRMLCSTNVEVPAQIYISWRQEDEHLFDKNTSLRVN
tara:strand:- start:305 stop:1282 length:978 start_codon:yes stop_codon:yes gene_type:complete